MYLTGPNECIKPFARPEADMDADALLGEVTQTHTYDDILKLGFPVIKNEEIPPCGMWYLVYS